MNTFRQALHGDGPVISAELSLRHDSGAADLLDQAEPLRNVVDGLQVTDNPHAWVQISPLAAASLLIEAGLDAIPQLTCRDRNRIALQSDLCGLRALGVSSLVLNKGGQVPAGHTLRAKPVFDVSCRELISMASAMNGSETGGPESNFLIGTGARVFAPPPGWDAEMMLARASAGAQFLQTQLCFDAAVLRVYMQRLVEARITWDFAVIVSLAPLPGVDTAHWLNENNRAALIPAHVLRRLEAAGDPEREGISLCAELMQEFAGIPGVSGFNLHTLGNPQAVVAAIAESGLRPATT